MNGIRLPRGRRLRKAHRNSRNPAKAKAVDSSKHAIVPDTEGVVVHVRALESFKGGGVSRIGRAQRRELRTLFS